ncbi:O-acetylhomoserine aminocarboxypropyltransferase/cysteine synthase family protein [Vibrio cincinnatiensis]|uniref:O-acetylhomoserine aminocarboxypropyltransferase/cysteine synthase family protein n=1 Tax=Vibrio cincinnatiensis TaxID=675 RepID=UPI0012AD1C06|nr:aminotransferase class I/II-fold pyridoxal phosphate-dependent enzyme [Vibrio cincinnatiensis]MCG3732103.1 aminotransferase class I/II-fold pyridoxal phosphate-dependent enzyme [Vibrio cincinnatiensis]MCG3736271.1 aminotransferase class I/II-fold pyridoxal phosphate-dependent enzyme [Vibrio cincinnatiensis]MCG3739814.1 aminotransferase class I/II-fold pyridoxal phosphate-dependent enzyme [Vibrio cincinnatiensis]MCG3742753.1 aminotransferase class I/II-fold pyridoxal phosphate-dependent enzym
MKRETIALHHGYQPDNQNAVAIPVHQTTSFSFDNAQHAADLFDLKVQGNIYSRIMNPTCDVLEQRIAALEGGVGALAVASGMAAITYAIQTIAQTGDNIVSISELYGGTYNLFAHTLPRQGIEVRFADKDNFNHIAQLIDANTRAIFCESIGNPSGSIVDIQALADIAHQHGVPLIVDNTVATPFLLRPFEHGADIVVHSATKYIGGHGTTIGGLIVDSGQFPWAEHTERFPLLNQPDVSYHGVNYTQDIGAAAFIARARVVPLRNMGAALSAQSAWNLLQGLETLALRIERINQNSLAVAKWLSQHPQVSWVKYAGLPTHKDHHLAEKYMQGQASGILSFGIVGGRDAGARFYDALKLILRLVNIGDAKSCSAIPAATTHRQLNDEELKAAGVSADMVRLSIGIEHIDDLISDLDQALKASQ